MLPADLLLSLIHTGGGGGRPEGTERNVTEYLPGSCFTSWIIWVLFVMTLSVFCSFELQSEITGKIPAHQSPPRGRKQPLQQSVLGFLSVWLPTFLKCQDATIWIQVPWNRIYYPIPYVGNVSKKGISQRPHFMGTLHDEHCAVAS